MTEESDMEPVVKLQKCFKLKQILFITDTMNYNMLQSLHLILLTINQLSDGTSIDLEKEGRIKLLQHICESCGYQQFQKVCTSS